MQKLYQQEVLLFHIRSFRIGKFNYKVRQLKPAFLYADFGLIKRKNYLIAGLERAVAEVRNLTKSRNYAIK